MLPCSILATVISSISCCFSSFTNQKIPILTNNNTTAAYLLHVIHRPVFRTVWDFTALHRDSINCLPRSWSFQTSFPVFNDSRIFVYSFRCRSSSSNQRDNTIPFFSSIVPVNSSATSLAISKRFFSKSIPSHLLFYHRDYFKWKVGRSNKKKNAKKKRFNIYFPNRNSKITR